jgi:hypothetical protein
MFYTSATFRQDFGESMCELWEGSMVFLIIDRRWCNESCNFTYLQRITGQTSWWASPSQEMPCCTGYSHVLESIAENVQSAVGRKCWKRCGQFHVLWLVSEVLKRLVLVGTEDRRGLDGFFLIATPLYLQKLALNFVDKWRLPSRYSSLAD